MVNAINSAVIGQNSSTKFKTQQAQTFNNSATTAPFSLPDNYTSTSLINAYKAYHGIPLANTVSFGHSIREAFEQITSDLFTCRESDAGAEKVAIKTEVNDLIDDLGEDLVHAGDALKTNVPVNYNKKAEDKDIEARTQLKRMDDDTVLFEMEVMPDARQRLRFKQDIGVPQQSSVLNTKGNLVAVLEDGNDILITNAGTIQKKDSSDGRLLIFAEQMNANNRRNGYDPFMVENVPRIVQTTSRPSVGRGTELVIGMEKGRFVPEVIAETVDFINRIKSGEIVLVPFVAAPNAQNLQLAMLAGGYGSRAEYANVASDKIFRGDMSGSDCTKGTYRTATGLTPMETTFVSLHNAGLLDCSRLQIGDNLKFYLNRSGVNKGNGGFTVDLYNLMARDGRKALAIFPNDSMSRLTGATRRMHELATSGKAAIAMIAKEVDSDLARGKFGIMKISPDCEILEFDEKPPVIKPGYTNARGNCLTNTFQFAISAEAFDALSKIEPFFPKSGKNKESRDWSKAYVPVIMTLAQNDDIDKISDILSAKLKLETNSPYFRDAVAEAKEILGGQRIYAVPTDEPWADCGTLNELYDTTMKIASGAFPLEDFERIHVLNSVDTATGLVASDAEQLRRIQDKYVTSGQVIAVKKADRINPSIVDDYIEDGLIVVNEPAQR